jgi:hypothetical protein
MINAEERDMGQIGCEIYGENTEQAPEDQIKKSW